MKDKFDSAKPEFWDIRYRQGRTPWDLGGIPACLRTFLDTVPAAGTVLIPGCGSGYEVRAFAGRGWQVTALDISKGAVERASQVLGSLASSVVLGDFFQHDFGNTCFDAIYERTFLCALPPACWQDYANRMAELLVPGGWLVGVFFCGVEPEPPPYPLTDAEAHSLFGGNFKLICNEPVKDSLPVFAGGERWQVWQKLPRPC